MKNFLKNRRHQLKLTMEELGRRMGSSKSRINNYERGVRFPVACEIWLLKQAYEMTDDELLSWLEYINKNKER